jgi:uncharacterized protein YoxC
MPDWSALIPDVSLLQAVLWLVAAALFIGVVVKLWPFVRNAVAIVDALVQLPPLAKQVAEMKAQIDGIHHETHKNDGSSIKDAVDRVEVGVAGLYTKVDGLEQQIGDLQAADEEIRADIEHTQPPKEET